MSYKDIAVNNKYLLLSALALTSLGFAIKRSDFYLRLMRKSHYFIFYKGELNEKIKANLIRCTDYCCELDTLMNCWGVRLENRSFPEFGDVIGFGEDFTQQPAIKWAKIRPKLDITIENLRLLEQKDWDIRTYYFIENLDSYSEWGLPVSFIAVPGTLVELCYRPIPIIIVITSTCLALGAAYMYYDYRMSEIGNRYKDLPELTAKITAEAEDTIDHSRSDAYDRYYY